jgi:hypothetical protein
MQHCHTKLVLVCRHISDPQLSGQLTTCCVGQTLLAGLDTRKETTQHSLRQSSCCTQNLHIHCCHCFYCCCCA